MQSFWSLAAAASFSLMAALVKAASGEFSTFEIVFYRSVFGVAAMALFARSRGFTLKTRYLGHHFLRSFVGVMSLMIWFFALGGMTFGTNMTLTYTTPLFMAANFLLLAKARRLKAPWGMAASILIGFTGIVLILRPEVHEKDLVPGLLCLFVAFLDLISYWQMKLMGRLNEPSWRIVFYFSVTGVVFGFLGTLFLGGGFHAVPPKGALVLAGICVLATLGQLFTTKAYAYGNMLLSSCLGFSAIPFSALIGWAAFGDEVSAASVTAMGLVLAAGVLATFETKRMEPELTK